MGKVNHVDDIAAVGDSVLVQVSDKQKASTLVRARLVSRFGRVKLQTTREGPYVRVWLVGFRPIQPKRRTVYGWGGGGGEVKSRLKPYPEERGRRRTTDGDGDTYIRDVVPLTDDQLTDEELARRRHYQETMRKMGIEP